MVAAAGALGSSLTVAAVLAGPSEYRLPIALYALYIVVISWMPLRYVPAALLTVAVLVPTKYLLPTETLAGTLSPPLVGGVVFAVRAWANARPGRPSRFPVLVTGGLTAWLLVGSAASISRSTSIAWSLSFIVLVIGVSLALSHTHDAVDPLQKTWFALGLFVAAFAALETYVLHDNPVFRHVFEHPNNGRPILQEWSVYRATTTLGHPLVNGLFLATVLPVATARFLRHRSLRAACAVALLMLGLAATGSRGSIAAGVIGTCVVLAVRRAEPGRIRSVSYLRVLAACGVGLALAVVAASTFLGDRSGSTEGAVSTEYRKQAFDTGTALVRAHAVAGSGPGTAIIVARQAEGKVRQTELGGALENSWLELAVAIGPVGLALVALLCSEALRRAIAIGSGAVAGSLVAYVVAAAGFNFLESQRPLHLFLGLLVGCALSLHLDDIDGATPYPSAHDTDEVMA